MSGSAGGRRGSKRSPQSRSRNGNWLVERRRGWDLNPGTEGPSAVFKTAPFGRSGTPPCRPCNTPIRWYRSRYRRLDSLPWRSARNAGPTIRTSRSSAWPAPPRSPREAPPPEPPRRHEERRPVTAVFVDIVGSTSRAEQLDPEDVLALLEPYYARLRHVLEQHGGSVEKFIGDAVVALFGAPVAHEDDPERAVRAGLAIIGAIDAMNEEDPTRELRVRVGVTTGEAIVALEARIGEGQGMAWGDVLNTAARLQSAAPVNGVLADERTYRACRGAIEFEDAEPIDREGQGRARPRVARGRRARVPGPQKRRDEPRRPRRRARTIDDGVESRDRDRDARLCDRRRRAGSRQEPAPARGLAHRAEGADVRVGSCLPYGEGITYWPIVQIMRDAAGVLVRRPDEVVSSKLDAFLDRSRADDLDQLRTIASTLSNLLGAPTTPRGSYATTDISQAELHWGIRRIFELLAARDPSCSCSRTCTGRSRRLSSCRVAQRSRWPGARSRLGAPRARRHAAETAGRERRPHRDRARRAERRRQRTLSRSSSRSSRRAASRAPPSSALAERGRQPALPRGDRPHARRRRRSSTPKRPRSASPCRTSLQALVSAAPRRPAGRRAPPRPACVRGRR